MTDNDRAPENAPTGRKTPASPMARRGFLLAGAALAGGATWALWPPAQTAAILSAPDAMTQAGLGQMTLVDIRRPDEWQRTGIAQGARALDMRRKDFETALAALVEGDRSRPIALICARGVRSRRMASRMAAAGFTGIVDVSEGMEGSAAGPGWVARGLPLHHP